MIDSDSDLEFDEQDSQEDELYEHFRVEVDKNQAPLRIDKFLMDRMERVSRNRVQNAIKGGSIRVNNEPVKPNFKIKFGHIITVVLPRPPGEDRGIKPQYIPLDVVYEDEDLMVINKPAGLVVHPGVGNFDNTLVNGLAYYFGKDMSMKSGMNADRPGLVHRIDKNTSGLLLIGKNEVAMSHLAHQFFEHTIDRHYIALVWGAPDPPKGTINVNVGRDPKYRMNMAAFPEGESGKRAVTHYEVLEDMYYVSLVRCTLETGRTHQIRVHMKHIGHTLFNDYKYNGGKILKGTVYSKYRQFVNGCFTILPRQALHAKTLGFEHPRTGERMFFECELPEDFKMCIDKWRSYVATRKAILKNYESESVDTEDETLD